MACPQQQDLKKKRGEKRTNYRQLAFEMREKRPKYVATIVLVVIGALNGGMNEMSKFFTKQELVVKTAAEVQETILMDSDTDTKSAIRNGSNCLNVVVFTLANFG